MNKINNQPGKRTALGKRQQIKTIRRPIAGREEENYLTKLRRNRVFRMRLQEYTIREICAELGASTQTICADLKKIDEALNETLDVKQASKILNQKVAELEAIKQMLIVNSRETTGMVFVAFMNTAAKYYDMQIKLLQDAGLLPKAVVKIGDPDGKPFTMPQATPKLPPIIFKFSNDEETRRAVAEFGPAGKYGTPNSAGAR